MDDNKVGVILEEVRDMFKTLGEGHKIMEGRLDRLEEGQKVIVNDVKDIKGRMDGLEGRMNRLEKDVKIIKSFVIATDDGLNDHERRITALEKKTASL